MKNVDVHFYLPDRVNGITLGMSRAIYRVGSMPLFGLGAYSSRSN